MPPLMDPHTPEDARYLAEAKNRLAHVQTTLTFLRKHRINIEQAFELADSPELVNEEDVRALIGLKQRFAGRDAAIAAEEEGARAEVDDFNGPGASSTGVDDQDNPDLNAEPE